MLWSQSLFLAGGWACVVAVAVALTNLAVATMNQQFTLLIAADLPCGVNCLSLGFMHRCQTGIALASDSPFSFVGNNVLVLAHVFIVFDFCFIQARAWWMGVIKEQVGPLVNSFLTLTVKAFEFAKTMDLW